MNDSICRTCSDCLLLVNIKKWSAPTECAAFTVTSLDCGEHALASLPHCTCGVRGTSSPQRARQCGESVSLNCSTTDRQRASFNIQPHCLLSSPRQAHCQRHPHQAGSRIRWSQRFICPQRLGRGVNGAQSQRLSRCL